MLEAKQKLKAGSESSTFDISVLPPKLQQVYEEAHSMFSLFPAYNSMRFMFFLPQMIDFAGQIKMVTLEIVKIHISESEHRVAHLMLNNLCNEYPNDPHLWSTLGKLYLDIGKKQAAVAAFEKAEQSLAATESASKEVVEAQKMFNQYHLSWFNEKFRGTVAAFDGKYKEAIEWFEKGAALVPTSIVAANNIAVCAM